jgi:hypothetical protein
VNSYGRTLEPDHFKELRENLGLRSKLLKQGGDLGSVTFEELDGAGHAKVLLRALDLHG